MNVTIDTNQMVEDAKQNVFSRVIGQTNVKKSLGWHFDNLWNGGGKGAFPHLFVKGPKGFGKTTLAEAVAKGIFVMGENNQPVIETVGNVSSVKRRDFVEINCASLEKKSLKEFCSAVLQKYVVDKDVTVFLDESHKMSNSIQNGLLSLLNPNPTLRNSMTVEDYRVEVDFKRQTFIFATSEAYKMFPALVDRLENISMEEYSLEELAKIVRMGLGEEAHRAEWNTLMEVATVLRGNARAGQRMSEKIVSMLGRVPTFGQVEWVKMCEQLSIHPLGLNASEVTLLRYLDERSTPCSLTSLSAKTGFGRLQLQQDTELYLQKHGLMEVTPTGRMITAQGRDYLKNLRGSPQAV